MDISVVIHPCSSVPSAPIRGGFQNAAKRTAPNPCYNRTKAHSCPTNADDPRTKHRYRHSSRRSTSCYPSCSRAASRPNRSSGATSTGRPSSWWSATQPWCWRGCRERLPWLSMPINRIAGRQTLRLQLTISTDGLSPLRLRRFGRHGLQQPHTWSVRFTWPMICAASM